MENVNVKRPSTDLKFNWILKCSTSVKCWGTSVVYSQFPGCPKLIDDKWVIILSQETVIYEKKKEIFSEHENCKCI